LWVLRLSSRGVEWGVCSLEVALPMTSDGLELRPREPYDLAVFSPRGSWAVLVTCWEGSVAVGALGLLGAVLPCWSVVFVDGQNRIVFANL